jgi:hypothetical protein
MLLTGWIRCHIIIVEVVQDVIGIDTAVTHILVAITPRPVVSIGGERSSPLSILSRMNPNSSSSGKY